MRVIVVLVALVGCVFGAVVPADQPKNNITSFSDLDDTVGIVGGRPTTIDKFPWIVALLKDNQHYCGASIISPNRLLTAAHCFVEVPIRNLKIRAGSTFVGSGGQIVQVSKGVSHPEYRGKFNHDIGVLWIDGSLNTNLPGISVIDLPPHNENEVRAGPIAHVAGWGRLCTGCPGPDDLHFVAIPIITNFICDSYYGNITPDLVCAGYLRKGSCHGDSGGPLNIGRTLVGSVVGGSEDCTSEPSVFINIAYHRNWIDSNM